MSGVRTVFLPPAPRKKGDGFDNHQFHKRVNIATKTSGISHDDIQYDSSGRRSGMHLISKHVSTLPIPPWTNSDLKVQLVVAYMLWQMIHMTATKFPLDRFENDRMMFVLEMEHALKKRCIDFFQQRNHVQQQVIAAQRRSKKYGYALLITNIIYQRYRRNTKSNAIAANFHGLVSPVGVRQLLSRANKVARVIFAPEDNLPLDKKSGERLKYEIEYKKAALHRKRTGRNTLPSPEEVFKLVQSGRTKTDIAVEYGCHVSSIDTKYRDGRQLVLEGRVRRRSHRMSVHEIVSAYKDGYTIEQLVNTSGRNLPFIHCVLSEHGLLTSPVPVSCDIDPSREPSANTITAS